MSRWISVAALCAALTIVATGCAVAPEADEPSVTAEVVASVPAESLVRAGHLTTCMDMPYKPFQYFDETGEPVGIDIDLINEVSARLDLKPNIQNSVFDTIIAALQGGKCDMIWADQYVTPERTEQIDMVGYWRAAEVVVVAKGNPKKIGSKDELCGLKAAGQKGGADVAALEELSAACVAAGDEAIDILQYPRSPDAYQALAAGHADAWVTEQVAALLLKNESNANIDIADSFFIGGDDGGLTAISFRKDDDAINTAVMAALQSMVDDGTYAEIWEKWGLTDAMLTPAPAE